ncbi:MBL fold metallo-hydrolase [Nocardiopsis sp. JB363]|uniref:MBL fold metallo-hydrolase n=1 Tax=Nocardiopsis sp. JB363 TaxID=1434837 RepID=UPI00097A1A5F|nr:MBL fold metallo-hydrolase [Nocardiopsis sp. JB363]SIO89412.1 Hydroxyacylglutathione hydrolase [Nocardiopsis sp. JB363]
MFWKRKSKKQEGQEATDSATEVAEGTEEETDDAVESEVEGAEKETATEKSDSEKTEKAEKTEAVEDEESEDTDTKTDEAEAEKSDSEDTDTDADTAEDDAEKDDADADSEESESDGSKESDVFAGEEEEVGVTGPDSEGITRVRSAGVFEFGEDKFDVVGNTWIIEADKDGVIVIDPAYDAEAILEAIGDREVYLVACTNGYSPHITAALAIAEETEADIALHPREMRSWRRVHGAEHRPEIEVEGGGALDVGDLHIDVLPLPGTSPGSVGFYISQIGAVFGGDTLREGGPGMVGDTHLDYTTQLATIGENLLTLPPDTRVLPDRGPSTTVEKENKNFDSWV